MYIYTHIFIHISPSLSIYIYIHIYIYMIQPSKQPPSPAGAWCVSLCKLPAPPVVMISKVFSSEFVIAPPAPCGKGAR